MIVNEFSFWSPLLGQTATRISTGDSRGREYFVIVPRGDGARAWRDTKQRALLALQAALDAELPGETKLNP